MASERPIRPMAPRYIRAQSVLTGKVPHVAVRVGALSEHFVLTTIGNPKFNQDSC
jgi:hypothetical protein